MFMFTCAGDVEYLTLAIELVEQQFRQKVGQDYVWAGPSVEDVQQGLVRCGVWIDLCVQFAV